MLQNKIKFNQSSVSLEIIGLPDYSNNENKDDISIISQWRLMIIDKPVIEGNVDHLKSIIKVFNLYSSSLLKEGIEFYESDLLDIKPENFYTHHLILKSTKPEVKPLSIRIGNSALADIVNCLDQFVNSNRVKFSYSKDLIQVKSKNYLYLFDKKNITNFIFTPLISLCSIFMVSFAFIYAYDSSSEKDRSSLSSIKNT